MEKYTLDTQKLDLPSIVNVRQLGGYEMADGRKVKNHMLIRSAALSHLSDEDKAKLEDMNLKAVIDFRSDGAAEAGNNPDIIPDGATYYYTPALDSQGIYDQDTLEAIDKVLDRPNPELGIDVLVTMAEHNGLSQMYSNFILKDMAKKAYRKMFDVLLENAKTENPGAILWHCTQGKDRAGIAAALILTALGADDEVVLNDYYLTTDSYVNEVDQMRKLAQDRGLSEETTYQLLGLAGISYPEMLQKAIDSVGSFKDYLIKDLGLSEADLKLLQDTYLE